jgi:UDP-glucose 4-epimerase
MGKILVTGGLGYIGSHTVVALITRGYRVLVADNLENSTTDVLEGIEEITGQKPEFIKTDISDKQQINELFDKHPDISACIHFAAYKAVGESVEKPLMYYRNNLCTLIFLLEEFEKRKLQNFIFSSSCTVYGNAEQMPLKEDSPRQKAASPYGNTKIIGEAILEHFCNIYPLQAISLRYFNPIGAHPSAKIGELPLGIPQNLVPYITQTALGIRDELRIWGNDYPTRDGTCIRDYIHVCDLADAHVNALIRLEEGKNQKVLEFYNVGTGQGSTVLEVIQAFERATGLKIPHRIENRRPGDVVAAYADTSLANKDLNWMAIRSLEDALASAYAWEKSYREKK